MDSAAFLHRCPVPAFFSFYHLTAETPSFFAGRSRKVGRTVSIRFTTVFYYVKIINIVRAMKRRNRWS
ncbi:MAG TPA: hypothetical protein DC013_00040 [Ruminococcaceae bacterium]|nr:hypothetical protein [Oscillospiraceae bacterium]